MRPYFRPGGVHQDLTPKLVDDIHAFCDPFLTVVDDLDALLTATASSSNATSTSAW
jgi:NADH-quinone oxidoreductase subunit D